MFGLLSWFHASQAVAKEVSTMPEDARLPVMWGGDEPV